MATKVILQGTPEYREWIDESGYVGCISLSTITTEDCFHDAPIGVADYNEGNFGDIINFIFISMLDYDEDKFRTLLPFLWSIDPYGHTFLAPYLVEEELENKCVVIE